MGVIGSGYIGKTYVEGMVKFNKRMKLVAISGGSRAPALAASYHVDYEPTIDSLLHRSDIDAVLVATPHSKHISQVIEAAEHGKHILVEKPMALSVQECDQMMEAAKRAGVYLEVIQTLRFRGVPKKTKELIEQGAIGSVRMIRGTGLFESYLEMGSSQSWLSDPHEGGAMLDMGVHNFDIMRFWTGSEVKRVFSKVLSFDPSRPQPFPTAMTQLSMRSGVMCQMWMSFEVPPPNIPDSQHRYVIVGDKGIIDADGYGKLLLGKGDKWETVWEQPYFDYVKDPMNPARLEAFYSQVQLFVDDVLGNRPPSVPGSEGRAAVEIVQAARLSSETGNAVDLPLTA